MHKHSTPLWDLLPPRSNWFKSCLAPSGQDPSISAAVTGLCCPLTVLLNWCCAASCYCANENLAPGVIFSFTGCALSMQNILAAFMGLRTLIIFNVCDTPGCKPVYGQENNSYVLSVSGVLGKWIESPFTCQLVLDLLTFLLPLKCDFSPK